MLTEHQPPTELIRRIHARPTMAVISAAGAGTAAISWLLGVAGASRTVLEIGVPYASPALTEFVGYEPPKFVSEETATAMAHSAYRRAIRLRANCEPVVGIGCTATIATDRAKRGEHRCFIAAWSADGAFTQSLTLTKGLRGRSAEDELVSKLILRALAESAGIEPNLDLELTAAEQVHTSCVSYADSIAALMAAHIDLAIVHPDGRIAADQPLRGGILSGSFNPLHRGHEALAQTAARILDAPVAYELSVANVDKPPLTEPEVRRRVAQFEGKAPLALTREPVFWKKSRLLPGCAFIIGADTAVRLVEPRYYEGSRSQMLIALERMRQNHCRFLVAGRSDGTSFRTLSNVPIPDGFEPMFAAIPETAFHSDISSTQIRQATRAVSL